MNSPIDPTNNYNGLPSNDEQPLYKQVVPDTVSLADINEKNRSYWTLPYAKGEDFENEVEK